MSQGSPLRDIPDTHDLERAVVAQNEQEEQDTQDEQFHSYDPNDNVIAAVLCGGMGKYSVQATPTREEVYARLERDSRWTPPPKTTVTVRRCGCLHVETSSVKHSGYSFFILTCDVCKAKETKVYHRRADLQEALEAALQRDETMADVEGIVEQFKLAVRSAAQLEREQDTRDTVDTFVF